MCTAVARPPYTGRLLQLALTPTDPGLDVRGRDQQDGCQRRLWQVKQG